MERTRIDRLVNPLQVVIVSGDNFFAATQFVTFLFFFAFDPLVVFYLAVQLGEVSGHGKGAVIQDVVGYGLAGGMHHLAVKRCIHLVGMLHFYGCLLCFDDGITGLDGAPLVPPQQHCAGQEHEEARSDLLERVAHAGSIASGCSFCVSHKCLNLMN